MTKERLIQRIETAKKQDWPEIVVGWVHGNVSKPVVVPRGLVYSLAASLEGARWAREAVR